LYQKQKSHRNDVNRLTDTR